MVHWGRWVIESWDNRSVGQCNWSVDNGSVWHRSMGTMAHWASGLLGYGTIGQWVGVTGQWLVGQYVIGQWVIGIVIGHWIMGYWVIKSMYPCLSGRWVIRSVAKSGDSSRLSNGLWSRNPPPACLIQSPLLYIAVSTPLLLSLRHVNPF